MDAEPVAIPEDASVERALDEYFLRYRWPWFPVVDAAAALSRPDRARGRRRRPGAEPRLLRRCGEVFEVGLDRHAAGARRRAARVAARQRRPAPARRR